MAADDEDALVGDGSEDPLAGRGDLVLVADAEPGPGAEDGGAVEGEDVGVEVRGGGEGAGLAEGGEDGAESRRPRRGGEARGHEDTSRCTATGWIPAPGAILAPRSSGAAGGTAMGWFDWWRNKRGAGAETPAPAAAGPGEAGVVAGTTAFAVALYRELARDGADLFFSPSSIVSARGTGGGRGPR